MKYCSKCGSGLADEAVVCNKCGCAPERIQQIVDSQEYEPQEKKKSMHGCLKAFLIVVGIAVIIMIIGIASTAGDSDYSSSDTGGSSQSSSDNKPNLEVYDETKCVREGYGLVYIVGGVKNNSDKTYGYVQVSFNLYDKSGNQIGTAMDNTNYLGPGKIWKFKALCFEDNFATYKLVDVTGW